MSKIYSFLLLILISFNPVRAELITFIPLDNAHQDYCKKDEISCNAINKTGQFCIDEKNVCSISLRIN